MMSLYTVEFWVLTEDGYDNRYIDIKAKDKTTAVSMAKESKESHRGKDFKILHEIPWNIGK